MKTQIVLALVCFSTLAIAKQQSEDLKFLLKETQTATELDFKKAADIKKDFMEQVTKKYTVPVATINKFNDVQERIVLNNEDFNNQLETNLLAKFRNSIQNSSFEELANLTTGNVFFSDLMAAQGKMKFNQVDGISYSTNKDFNLIGGQDQFIKQMKAYLKDFSKIEYVDIQLLQTDWADNKTAVAFSEADKVSSKVHLEIRGILASGQRRADKAEVMLGIIKNSDGQKISDIRFNELFVSKLDRQPAFAAVAQNAGFDSGKTYPRLEALRRGGYGFAMEDINNDGHLDAFVGNYGDSTVWFGKDGKFTQQPMEEVNKVNLAKAAAFVDFDNDGWKDLFVTRFAADNLVGDILIFKNNKGKFTQVKGAFPTNILRDYAMPTAIADFNNDGLLDIYVGFPGERDFSAGAPTGDLAVHGLFINKDKFRFQDDTAKFANKKFKVMPHGALATDFNMDGFVDIIVMDDQKNLSPMYQNRGNADFKLTNNDFKVMNYGYGMGVAAGDFNQDGLQDIILSNATFNAQNRLAASIPAPSNPVLGNNSRLKGINKGLRMFTNSKNKSFTEVTQNAGLLDTGDGAGGVTVIDYDNDGLQDIYLVNGLWSGSSRDEKIDSLFAKAINLGIANQNHLQDGLGDRTPEASKSIFMKVLMNDRVTENNKEKTMSFAGYQRNRLFKNLGGGKFIEVGYLEGVDSMSDGYMSAVADINRDGKADLVLRNCDPGAADNTFAPVEIYQNNYPDKKAAWITLKGTKSNSMGVGAKLYATIGKKTHYREVFANNSAMQGEVVAHFGMGNENTIKVLKIVWPSGLTSTFKNVKPGPHVFEEKVNAMAAN